VLNNGHTLLYTWYREQVPSLPRDNNCSGNAFNSSIVKDKMCVAGFLVQIAKQRDELWLCGFWPRAGEQTVLASLELLCICCSLLFQYITAPFKSSKNT